MTGMLETKCGKGIDPALKDCQTEFDAAARAGDIEKMKAIIKREGLEWIDYRLPEKYRTGIDC